MRDLVGVHQVSAARGEHLCYYCFSAGESSCNADTQAHAKPRRILAAFTVFDINMAMVSGPTPPGTGVMAPATSATRGCTSPTSVEPLAANCSSRFGSFGKNSLILFWSI